jgi:ribosomal protein S18 acetylase RimI-like enzyme
LDITIRRAIPDDYDALCEIMDEVDRLHREHLPHIFRQPEGPVRERDFLVGQMSDANVGLFVAEVDGKVVGMAHGLVRDTPPLPILVPRRYASIDNVGVKQEFRRAGIGRALMRHAEQWARTQGADSVELSVWEFNEVAQALYRSLGYQTYNRRMSRPLGSEEP